MKIQKVMQAKNVFTTFANKKVSPVLAYKLFKFIEALEQDESFYNKKAHELLEEYGQKNKNGVLIPDENGNAIISDDKKADFESACRELNAIEVMPPDISFTLDELSGFSLSAVDMSIINDFIKEK